MFEMFGKKDSFERFYGDLDGVIEVIVSYLPLEDRFAFESLSKRFQTLISNINDKVVDIDVDDKLVSKMYGTNIFGMKYFSKKYLQILMTKCPNITRVDTTRVIKKKNLWQLFVSMNEMRDNWPNLTAIGLKLSKTKNNIRETLFEMFGQMITKLDATDAQDFDHSLLPYCHRLSHLKVDSMDMYFRFAAIIDVKNLKSFTIKNIDSYINSSESVIELMSHLIQLQELRQLSLQFDTYVSYSLSDFLHEIGLKLNKLKKFSLRLEANQTNSFNSLKSMESYRGLRFLELNLQFDGLIVTDWRALDSMQCLPLITHLSLDLCQITNEFITKIICIFPNIRSLDIHESSNCCIKDINLILISRLRLLKTLKIREAIDICVDEWDLKDMFARSDRLESIHITDGDKSYIQLKDKHIIYGVPELSTPVNSSVTSVPECRCCRCHCRKRGDTQSDHY